VPDEGMSIDWPYIRTLARRSEELGYDVTLIAELNLNDIKVSTRRRSMHGQRRRPLLP
jgi:hypothetical protein